MAKPRTILHIMAPGRDQVTGDHSTLCGLSGLRDLSARPFPPYDRPWKNAGDRYSSGGVDFYSALFPRGVNCKECKARRLRERRAK